MTKHQGPGSRPRKGMKRRLPDLLRRQRAVQRTQDRFAGKVFALGSNDCWKATRFHLKAMGHEMPGSGKQYAGVGQAAAVLKANGCKTLADVLDKFLPRITPAAMLLGDVAVLKSEPEEGTAHQLGTIVISAGTKFLGWHPDQAEFAVMDVYQIEAAWRA